LARLNVEAVSDVPPYADGVQDRLEIDLSVSDEGGNPVTTLTQNHFSLLIFGDLKVGYESIDAEVTDKGFYTLVLNAYKRPGYFYNGAGAIGIQVSNGADHGQTLVYASVEGRPPHPEPW